MKLQEKFEATDEAMDILKDLQDLSETVSPKHLFTVTSFDQETGQFLLELRGRLEAAALKAADTIKKFNSLAVLSYALAKN